MPPIRARDRDSLLQSLRAGVVPRTSQHLIQVGRVQEITAVLADIDRLCEGGSSFRLIVGEYGAGKTFFLNLVRAIALEKKLVTMHADLNPDRRLHASGGQARSLFAELTRSTATRSKPDGGALPGLLEKFISNAQTIAADEASTVNAIVRRQTAALTELVNGYDFADVLLAYWRGHEQGDEELKANAIRWMRGEFGTRTEARAALGVRNIVDDADVYDQLKLLARFVRLAGFGGLLVCLDEMVNLYKMSNKQARDANYEQILRILNDTMQGSAEGLGFVLGGTPEFLLDTRRGLYSYAALQRRLAQNNFTADGLQDFQGPTIRLAALTEEDFYVLLTKLRDVYAAPTSLGTTGRYNLPDEAIAAFMEHCSRTLGEQYFRTPGTTIVSFLNLLAVLDGNEGADWRALLNALEVQPDTGGEAERATDAADDELVAFTLNSAKSGAPPVA